MRKHSVTFYSPGTFFPESSSRSISSWDTKLAVEMSKNIEERYGARPHSFRFSTMLTADPVPADDGGTLDVMPREVDKSPLYYLGGKILTYLDILERNDPKDKILISNMEGNRMWVIIENINSYRFTGEFPEDACIVNENGEITRRGNDEDLRKYRAKKNKEKDEELREQGILV